jgi:TRAP transporter 4TM/12TM fusion protein
MLSGNRAEDGTESRTPGRLRRTLGYLGLIGEGNRHRPSGVAGYVVILIAVALSLYELWLGGFGTHPALQYSVIFMTAMLPVTFLTTTATRRSESLGSMDVILAVVSFATGVYLLWNVSRYLNWVQGISIPTLADVVAGIVIVIIVFEASRRTVGWGLTSVLAALMAYTFLGHMMSGAFSHRPIDLYYFLEQQVFTTNGLFGAPVQVAATYAFLFVLFGNLFHKAKGGQFFFDLAASLTGRMIGGPAKSCIASSGLYGSISGSPTADVATTGQINIPLMKRLGYPATFSGAVEATASSGGALLPPVMGAVAFLMAEFTGIPYARIMQAAILVAVLYYLGVFLQVHHRTRRWGMGRMAAGQIIGLWRTFWQGWLYLLPLFVLVYFLIEGYTPSAIAVAATATTLLISWLKPSTRIWPRDLLDAFVTTTIMMVSLAAAVAAAGLVIGDIDLTGLAGKFTYLIFAVTGGSLVLALIMAMVISILLGMGMPTPAVYVMTAALVAPPLLDFGVPVLETHMFLLYFAAMSAITPPIAVAAFTAAPIANANPMAIGFQSVRLAAVGFIFPYVFVARPGLLMKGGPLEIADAFLSGLIAAFALAVAVEGWFGRGPLSWPERLVLLGASLAAVYPSAVATAASAVVVVGLLGFRHFKPRWAPPEDQRHPPLEEESKQYRQPSPVPEALE